MAGEATDSSGAVVFDSVTKTYSTKYEVVKALDSVTFTVERGAVVAIAGPSGSGKTTLLNMAAALDFPSQGAVRVGGTDVSDLRRESLQKFRNEVVGVVFQQFFLVGHLTVLGNVMVPLIPRDDPPAEKERPRPGGHRQGRIGREGAEVPLRALRRRTPESGHRRGMVGDPQVILADEPTGNLDSKKGSEIVDLLVAESRERGRTVLIATHDLRLMERVDGVVFLLDGRLSKVEGRGVRDA